MGEGEGRGEKQVHLIGAALQRNEINDDDYLSSIVT